MKVSNRRARAIRMYERLLSEGIVNEQQYSATILLAASCYQCEERTRKTKTQKTTYKDIHFNFVSPYEMALYIISLPMWFEWQEQAKIYDNIPNTFNKEKENSRPTVDRIESEEHYERGNIRHVPMELNRDLSHEKKKKPQAYFYMKDGKLFFKKFNSITDIESELDISSYYRKRAINIMTIFQQKQRNPIEEIAELEWKVTERNKRIEMMKRRGKELNYIEALKQLNKLDIETIKSLNANYKS
ncbi:hypothetical protein MKZ08_06670 [Viridibacillus sp. FSL R5-0477]|uniref:Uncharacterized protein n=1 Tax=Viridibacillus arenosi FSL R5-213 TaxID=1227360 RepID=W4EQH4_9BACL|nr:hypothetical protein [Viridibacillus arenosi]ETT82257.1 hypothetical protein C176_14742 [Viridibacillus arenosi FSL R5-213]OMC92639.1 hypothetical protein BK137_06255 [Viridibacillus arenosi]